MYDVAVIGGGPAGLSAALMLGRCRRRVVVVDAGKPRNAAAKIFHGYLGRDHTNPRELLEQGRAEVAKYGVELLQDVAIAAERCDAPNFATCFSVKTQNGKTLRCRKLLFATGMCDEIPTWQGVAECYGTSVHHCPYCDGWEHRDTHLVAFGSTPSAALGLAQLLRNWSEQVTVVTDGAAIEPADESLARASGIATCTEVIEELVHREGHLESIRFQDGSSLRAEALFFNTSQSPQCQLPCAMGCEIEEAGAVRTRPKQRTNLPGVFLVGDADGDVQFVIVAAAEGATAAVAIHRELQDEDAPRE